jgi:hypothetical protein
MSAERLPRTETTKTKSADPKNDGNGATEDQVDVRDTIAQRIDRKGTKIEDLAGTGENDSSGG